MSKQSFEDLQRQIDSVERVIVDAEIRLRKCSNYLDWADIYLKDEDVVHVEKNLKLAKDALCKMGIVKEEKGFE